MDRQFKSGQQMLDHIKAGNDLYDKQNEIYVHLYTDDGSIAVYSPIKTSIASLLNKEMLDIEESFWSPTLTDGEIYDDKDNPNYDGKKETNLDWCNRNFMSHDHTWTECGLNMDITQDESTARIKTYIRKNFELDDTAGTIVDNIIKYVAIQGMNTNEALDELDMLLDGVGIEKYEILDAVMDI